MELLFLWVLAFTGWFFASLANWRITCLVHDFKELKESQIKKVEEGL